MCGVFDDVFGAIGDVFGGIGDFIGDNLGSLLSVASFIPGPWQPFALGLNAMYNIANENPLGAAMSALGATGAFGAAGDAISGGASVGAPGATELLGSVDDLSGAWGSIGQGSTTMGDFATGASSSFGGLDSAGSALSNFDGLSSLGGGSTAVNQGFSGFGGLSGGDPLGEFISTLPQSSTEGGQAAVGGAAPGATQGGGFMNQIGLGGVADAMAGMQNGTMNLSQAAQAAQKSPLMQTLMGAGKLYSGYQDYRSAQDARQAYADNVKSLQQLYSPNSAYAQQARKAMERRDAARGRNSQYGPRETQLAALLADKQAQVMSGPGYLSQLGASKQRGAGLGGLFGGSAQMLRGLGGLF